MGVIDTVNVCVIIHKGTLYKGSIFMIKNNIKLYTRYINLFGKFELSVAAIITMHCNIYLRVIELNVCSESAVGVARS